ncbi:lipoxygenase 2, chloroplastic-like [Humulus lupulus]|uniref:lipoxygenase 2, chloroplastic-like n=1 Tax=Humulus lupulus TaxID=3486 RepID=UPI002B4095D7|nr:lipoxygenase 2, chloroplastic-like [Humulus lupulus]
MLKPQVVANQQGRQTSLLLNKPFIHGNGSLQSPISFNSSLLVHSKNNSSGTKKNLRVAFSRGHIIKASLLDRLRSSREKTATKKGTVSVVVQRETAPKVLSEKAQDLRDRTNDFLGVANFSVELISAEKDPETGKQRKKKCFPESKTAGKKDKVMNYEAKVDVPLDFGEVGAVVIENDFEREIYVKTISLKYDDHSSDDKSVNFSCESWVQSKRDVPHDQQLRLFFSDKSYLPSKTPSGLRDLRKEELKRLRGTGREERKEYERVYDYDVYNDLGDPDKSTDLQRPVLGGPQHPYPRRGRTGRPPAKNDLSSESRGSEDKDFYVPRDETFAEVKSNDFGSRRMELALKNIIPFLENNMFDEKFPNFTDIDKMFKEGYEITDKSVSGDKSLKQMLLLHVGTKLYSSVLVAESLVDNVIKFKQPPTADMDKFFWFRDEEFARQTLAGLNPCCLQLVTKWPLKSELDEATYGPQESKITTEIVEQQLKAYDYTLLDARREKKLYLLDYHDVLLPYVSKVRKLKGRTLYGSRTLFFLTPYGTLMPVAIELTRPPMDGQPQWKEVYTPTANWHSTDIWLWKLAKAHVLAHDAGVHQLVSHWLRTHCAVEPYVIATNRQLSAMHPINRLLQPHLRYTMEINARARKTLINADGVIESTFSPGKYCIELSSVIYDKQWQFDLQALPADLVHRGMAVEDETCEHGLRLTIEDYPYANDGLLIWDAIKQWVTDYVNHYYANSSEVERDEELQEWWKEIRTVGHADKKEGWPELKTREDLIDIVTNIAWIASGHHAAVNFGQYAFSAYFPNRPSLTRTTMPSEDKESRPDVWKAFKENPEDTILKCFPSQLQAAKNMATLDLLSTHASDEEYLGHHVESTWMEDPNIYSAFKRFQERIKKIEDIIDERNDDENLKNRHGAGTLPYEFLKPFSEEGVTNKGVPYSISI